jgi:DNA-binding transcriptional LysR family regulator
MDLRQLRQFVAVADELHFGRAAARLNMEQAPLSQAIKRLEAALGATLFDRSPRGGTRLTPAGRVLRAEAEQAIRAFDRAVAQTRRAAGSAVDPLQVGFVTAGVLAVLPRALAAFSAGHPGVPVRLAEGATADLLRGVQEDRLQMALVHPVEAPPPGVTLTEVQRDRTVAALPRAHPLAGRRSLHLRDLAGEPLIFFPRAASPDLYRRFMQHFARAGFRPRIEQEASATPTILLLVAAGLGYALVPDSARSLDFAAVAFVPLVDLPDDLAWPLALAWKPATASATARALAARILPPEVA